MNKFVLFLLLVLSTASFAQSKPTGQQTYTQTEFDLKLQLQDQKMETLSNTVNENKVYLNECIAKQEARMNAACNEYSDHIGLWSGWMTSISIVAAIFLAFMGWFIVWRFKSISKDVNKELESIRSIKADAEKVKDEAERRIAEINKLKEEVEKLEIQADANCTKIQLNADKSERLVKMLENVKLEEQTENNKVEIAEYVKEVNDTKPESQLTAEDWFLKGYNAQMKEFYEDAYFYYKKSVELDPNDANVYNNWGNVVCNLAKRNSDVVLFKNSFNKFEKAIELNQNDSTVYNNWGIALSELAILNSDKVLFEESFTKFQKAAELKCDDPDVYYNWGMSLSSLAMLNSDTALFKESFTKFIQVVRLKPDYPNVYDNWGNSLLIYTRITDSLIQHKDELESILLKGNSLDGTSCLYNLSCLYSRLNEKDKALEKLEKDIQLNLGMCSREKIESDPDFENIKFDPLFIALLDKYFPN